MRAQLDESDRCRRVHPPAHVRDRRRSPAHAVGDRRGRPIESLLAHTVPAAIRMTDRLALGGPRSPESVLGELRDLAAMNKHADEPDRHGLLRHHHAAR